MFIHKVVSYGGAWDRLLTEFPDVSRELQEAIFELTEEKIENADLSAVNLARNHDKGLTFYRMQQLLDLELRAKGWGDPVHFRKKINNFYHLGRVRKDIASVAIISRQDFVNRWLYTHGPLAIMDGAIKIPIAIFVVKDDVSKLFPSRTPSTMRAFERTLGELEELAPLSHAYPFLIVGIGFSEQAIEIVEIESAVPAFGGKVVINREIEFPPEYRQAGIGILSYFGEVLRTKYPSSDAKVKIEQDGLTVRLVIESESGEREIIEKALQDYELVVRGETDVNDFFESSRKVVELKNELRILQYRIESQNDIARIQEDHIRTLKDLIGKSLTNPHYPAINVEVNPVINVSASSNAMLTSTISEISELIEILAANAANDPSLQLRLHDLSEAVDSMGESSNANDVMSSVGMTKLTSFMKDAVAAGSSVHEFLKKICDGVDVAQKLASKYNQLASWCGIPQIPSIFLGKNS